MTLKARDPAPDFALPDQSGNAIRLSDLAYGAWGEKSMYGRKFMGIVRSAFLIDEAGNMEQAWPKISPKDTPTNLLKALGG